MEDICVSFWERKKEKISPYHCKYDTDLSILTMKVFTQSEAGNKGVLGINTDTESKQHEKNSEAPGK